MTGGFQLAHGPGQIMRLGHHSTLRLLSRRGPPNVGYPHASPRENVRVTHVRRKKSVRPPHEHGPAQAGKRRIALRGAESCE
jgi:hypothetical protein